MDKELAKLKVDNIANLLSEFVDAQLEKEFTKKEDGIFTFLDSLYYQ